MWGRSIGKKFEENGKARRYPGNTVVAKVQPGNPAYDVMARLRELVAKSSLADHYILMPEDSYHMTLIRGLNDQVRSDAFWPKELSKDLPMEKVDDHVSAAVARAGIPGAVRMRLVGLKAGSMCIAAVAEPADEETASLLRSFRDRAADEIGLRLPKHDGYVYHITLAYTRVVPQTPEEVKEKEVLLENMKAVIGDGVEFVTDKPYMAYFDDMLAFSPVRLPR